MHQTIALFAGAALLALLAAALVPRLKRELRRPAFWLALTALACVSSAASALVAETGHAGTGFVTRHGWPKPFRFEFVIEPGQPAAAFEPLYFAGNSLAHAAALLLAWRLWRIVRAAAGAGSARPGT
ncbi:MAG TPA: hypothetical protein VK403_04415 [Allosphingosinicella sp.]|nr:hypothetical protein [Allosphingosinicella sp.]